MTYRRYRNMAKPLILLQRRSLINKNQNIVPISQFAAGRKVSFYHCRKLVGETSAQMRDPLAMAHSGLGAFQFPPVKVRNLFQRCVRTPTRQTHKSAHSCTQYRTPFICRTCTCPSFRGALKRARALRCPLTRASFVRPLHQSFLQRCPGARALLGAFRRARAHLDRLDRLGRGRPDHLCDRSDMFCRARALMLL